MFTNQYSGTYAASIMEELDPRNFFDLSDFQHSILFSECQFVWDPLKKIGNYLKSKRLGMIEVGIPQGAHLLHPEMISIGKGTVVEPGAYIKGPCIIGENCSIRQGAYIRGHVIVGDNCVIGHDSEIKNSIMLNHSNAPHFAYVGDCILGNYVNLGAGTKCSNLRLDHGEVVIHFLNKKINTGLKKFGAILGDETQIGCNCVINPGTITGKGVQCYPCISFGGYIPPKSIIKPSHPPQIISS